MFHFQNSYADLPARFYASIEPTPVAAPEVFAFNEKLSKRLGLEQPSQTDMREVFSGSRFPKGASGIAQFYAGHQFGNWVPQLGDGRAVQLGEVIAPDGARFDIQLKGSGRTPFSRGGDGRSALGPVVREYLVSEAMHHIGVPTTRALAATRTGEQVLRSNGMEQGGVLTRVAASHIRVGTFEGFAARDDKEGLQLLLDHALARHAPDKEGPLGLLDHVMTVQTALVSKWMSLGFIHGVMNTDNMTISGETIDYGPCAFMESFHPAMKFSAIDRMGRYAWHNQPDMSFWNVAQLANALVPLWSNSEKAIDELKARLGHYAPLYHAAWHKTLGAKLGLPETGAALGEELLSLMAQSEADFTLTFRRLGTPEAEDMFEDKAAYRAWERRWLALGPDESLMARSNPVFIPRNHLVQRAITACEAGDDTVFQTLNALWSAPYTFDPDKADYMRPALPEEEVTQTFCGT